MFAVLALIPADKTLKAKILERFRKPQVNTAEVSLEERFFFKIEAKEHRGKIPWKEIEDAAWELRDRFILPFDVKVSRNECEIKEFSPKILPKLMLFNSACKEIEKAACKPKENSITVIDDDGIYVNLMEKTVPLASTIRVVTKQPQNYKALSESMMRNYGLSLIISESFDDGALGSRFVIAYNPENIPLLFEGTVFSGKKKRFMKGSALIGGGITLPEKYEKLWQRNTNKLQFASALYELCGVKELQKLCFDEMCS